jgi:hypothetical protein
MLHNYATNVPGSRPMACRRIKTSDFKNCASARKALLLRMNWSNNLSKKLRNSYNAMKRLLREINI